MTANLPSISQDQRLMRVEQVAAVLGISTVSVYQKLKTGQLRSLSLITNGKTRGRRFVLRESVEQLISNSAKQ